MANRGYFSPQAGRKARRANAQRRRAPSRKQADPYTLDQNRDNPDVTDYDRSPQALEHEMPDMRTEWEEEERTPVGLPAPSAEASRKPRLNRKEARQIEAHAGRALRVAKAMIPEGALKRFSVAARSDLLLCQARDLMALSQESMKRLLARVEATKKFAASFQPRRNVQALEPEDPMGGPMEAPPPSDDLEGEPLEDDLGDLPEGEGLDPEIKEYIDDAVEEEVEEHCGDLNGGPDGEMDLEPEGDLPGLEDEGEMEMPSDEELLGLLDEREASRSRYARDPNHWEESVMDVDKPSEDYHSQEADYYESDSNSEDFEEQMDLSNPVMDRGANRRRQRRRDRYADGETSVEDPGGLNPFDQDEDYHDPSDHAYEEKPMSVKFEEQMELSNPLAEEPDRNPPVEASYYDDDADPILSEMMLAGVRKERIPVDAYGQIDPSIQGSAIGREARGAEHGPTLLADFVQGRRQIDPQNVMNEGGGMRRAASRRPPARRRPPQARANRPKRRRTASQSAPRKAGVRSVAHLGRKASANPKREIDALSAMWKSDPDVSKVFG